MHILMGLGHYETGGFSTVVDALSKYLQRKGAKVDIGALSIHKNPPNYVNVHKLSPPDFILKSREYDIIHIHLTFPYLFLLIEKGFKNIVLTHHGITPVKAIQGLHNKVILPLLNYTLYKYILKRIPIVVSNSIHTKKQLKRIYGINTNVIYNGVDTEIFKPLKTNIQVDGYPIFINVTSWKNPIQLIKSFKILRKHFPDSILIAIGLPKSLYYEVKRKTELQKSIIVFEKMPQDKLVYLYNSADIYFFTSDYESFGLPMIEAMACGKPVVALKVNDARIEHIQLSKAGRLYDANNPGTLIQAVSDILENYSWYSQRALSYAQMLSFEKVADKYMKEYKKLLQQEN